MENLETTALPQTQSVTSPSRDDDKTRGIVSWAKWLGISALVLYAANYAFNLLQFAGLVTIGDADFLPTAMFYMELSLRPLTIVLAVLIPTAVAALAIAWLYYHPETIRAFLILAASLEAINHWNAFVEESWQSFTNWVYLACILAVIISCIFVVKPRIFWAGAAKAQRALVSALYIAVVAQWLAIIAAAVIFEELSYSPAECVFFFLSFGLLLSRAKIGWFAGIASSAWLLIIFCTETQGDIVISSEPSLPLLIFILLFLPPIIRWYFPAGIWAYLGEMEKRIVAGVSRQH